jgi:hypothetical protein
MTLSTDLIEQARRTLDERPVIEVRLTLWTGEQIHRMWTWQEVQAGAPTIDPQSWMRDPRKLWPHPQDPITFEASVTADDDDVARAWLRSL